MRTYEGAGSCTLNKSLPCLWMQQHVGIGRNNYLMLLLLLVMLYCIGDEGLQSAVQKERRPIHRNAEECWKQSARCVLGTRCDWGCYQHLQETAA